MRAELPALHAFRDIRVQRRAVPRSEFEGGSQLAPGLLSFGGQGVELGLGVLVDGELVHRLQAGFGASDRQRFVLWHWLTGAQLGYPAGHSPEVVPVSL